MHPPEWTLDAHYGWCGQSCPCCRYRVEGAGGLGACEDCDALDRARAATAHAEPVCRVAGCRHADTHVTAAHTCGRCGGRGHGVRECGRAARQVALVLASADAMPAGRACTVAGCAAPRTHATAAHHCAACGGRAHECGAPAAAPGPAPTAACPACRAVGEVDLDAALHTGGECVVCYEQGPMALFRACRHALVCRACAARL